jgi:hypothetical protein
MHDPAEYDLVCKALTCGVTGCVEWDPTAAIKVRRDRYLRGLTPEGIQEDLIDYVTKQGGQVRQVKEKRPEYNHRAYWYKVIVPYPDLFRRGLFVEMELFDSDPDYPVVHLLNAHEN